MTTSPPRPDRPSAVRVLVGYPNADPSDPAGADADDYPATHRLSIRQMLGRKTVKMTHPEVVRRHVAMFVAYAVEVGGLAGFGTFWRPGAEQMANHERNPRQFSHPDTSYHVEVAPWGLAVACDTVPASFWKWMHANADRFGLVHLTKNEQHHTSPAELPKSRRVYNADVKRYAADLDGALIDLPYLGRSRLGPWLDADAPFKLAPAPPTPTPAPAPAPAPTPPPIDRKVLTVIYNPAQLVPGLDDGSDLYRRSVRTAQALMNGLMLGAGADALAVDGDYGPKTQAAVKQWQRYHRLTVDGWCGARTWASLLPQD